jgi:Uma2 family endonuclease
MDQLQELERLEQAQTNPEQRIPMNDLEFLQRFDEDTHTEWVDGEAIVFMSPTTRHQRIVNFLHLLIGTFLQIFRYGELFEAPYAMRIDPNGSIREPDLLFVANEHASLIGDKRLNGPADLIIEVISTESISRDRGDKFYEYQAGGVREYWVIDPRPGLTRADFWVLDDTNRYRPITVAEDGIYRSTVLQNFAIDVNLLLSDNLPEPMKVLMKMVGKDAMIRAFEE